MNGGKDFERWEKKGRERERMKVQEEVSIFLTTVEKPSLVRVEQNATMEFAWFFYHNPWYADMEIQI